MVATGAIWRRHLHDDGIQWLPVKPWTCSIGVLVDVPHVVPLHFHGNQNCQQFAFMFVIANFIVTHNSSYIT